MGTAYLDWGVLALGFAVLSVLALRFSRRTLRTAVLVTLAAGVAVITRLGTGSGGHHPPDFAAAFLAGADGLVRVMFSPLIPTGPGSVAPGLAGWITLLVILAGGLGALDTLCALREQPRVQVAEPGTGTPAGPGRGEARPGDRQALLEELKFRLPAIEVRKPATMPGGSTLEALASLISDSAVAGARATAALMQAVHALEAQPRVYEVRVYTQRCAADGRRQADGDWLHITVDLRNVRTGQNVAVRTLPPCPPDEAAKRVAGFTARQVFLHDHSTPAWAVGSADGEDLSAYLIANEISPRSPAFADVHECRQRQRRVLETAVRQSRNAGLVQYELAALYDIDGDNLESLLLHLDNRVHHPRLLRGRYRLAMSLSMLAGPVFDSQWRTPGTLAGPEAAGRAALKEEIIRRLDWSGLLARLGGQQIADLLRDPDPAGDREQEVKLALLTMARHEFRYYQRSSRIPWLLWSALWHRPERHLRLEMLRTRPGWLHPRRRMMPAAVAREVIGQRLSRLRDPQAADARLWAAQQRVLRRIGLPGAYQADRPWAYGQVPWQAVYNAACLCALPLSAGQPDPDRAETAVRLLRLAVSDPDCELTRPSEWIAMDPDLRALRGLPSFGTLVREQARWDFTPSPDTGAGDPWLQRHLPAVPAGAGWQAGPQAALPVHEPGTPALVPPPAPPSLPGTAPPAGGKRAPRHRTG